MARFRIILLIGFMLLSLGAVVFFFQKPVEPNDEPWRRATRIMLGDPQLDVLRALSGPTCRDDEGEAEIWIYAPDESARQPCTPVEGDLVVRFDAEGNVSAYEPEFGLRAAIESDVEQMRFRRVVLPQKGLFVE